MCRRFSRALFTISTWNNSLVISGRTSRPFSHWSVISLLMYLSNRCSASSIFATLVFIILGTISWSREATEYVSNSTPRTGNGISRPSPCRICIVGSSPYSLMPVKMIPEMVTVFLALEAVTIERTMSIRVACVIKTISFPTSWQCITRFAADKVATTVCFMGCGLRCSNSCPKSTFARRCRCTSCMLGYSRMSDCGTSARTGNCREFNCWIILPQTSLYRSGSMPVTTTPATFGAPGLWLCADLYSMISIRIWSSAHACAGWSSRLV
mmetsp:Transcript_106970/g.180628  ORF Transcript_106970/g.180628 Transcript_106970/m.180628 type:complete len:268 (+) Transcript_106970:108-911(+)